MFEDYRKAPLWVPLAVTAAVGALAVGVGLGAGPDQLPTSALAAPTARVLTLSEAAGVQHLLDQQHRTAVTEVFSFTARGQSVAAKLSITADRTSGYGTVGVGLADGQALLDHGNLYVRADQQFWQALGVDDAELGTHGWVRTPPEFFDRQLFAAPVWTAALTPGPDARIRGALYTVRAGWAHINGISGSTPGDLPDGATLMPQGRRVWIDHWAVGGSEGDVVPEDPGAVGAAAAELARQLPATVRLTRNPSGAWSLASVNRR
ncbi:hypothetical protein [Mycobacteroides abscessus]|uniref:Uncharacterized protein n=1 Tax=Mycobacteroides abscessus TaxID=36809 RepID=A0A0U0ZSX7_9MYCO|nr:hypothetical protein [Mycobacteroides abscessus]CPV66536.1 Uncharacterised protein [Mycobacteroides abscessus]